MCWGLPSGDVLLFGGHDANTSDTERVFKNGTTSEIAFSLKINHQKIEYEGFEIELLDKIFCGFFLL